MKYSIHAPLLALVFLLMAGMTSCVKEGLELTEDVYRPQAQQVIGTSVYGTILNKAGEVLTNADVSLKTHQGEIHTKTDENGNFDFLRILNPGPSAFLRIEAPGYFDGFRRLSVLPDNYNYTRVRLLEKTIVGSIPANSGGVASTNEGMKVSLPGNAVQYSNGTIYEGDVRVAMAWIDPSSEDLPDLVVGDLTGVSEDGRPSSLASFGMVNVELLADNGQELEIIDGQVAELSFPVPNARLSAAPSTIPLWSYDETYGHWFEESSASLEDGKYVGDVSHFSSWNCDWKGETISINGCVDFDLNNTLRSSSLRAQVLVCSDLLGTKGGWICPDGKFLFYNFPKGEAFTLKIKDECGNVVFEGDFGPYDTDTELDKITVDLENPEVTSLTGSAVNCDGNPVTNGYVNAVTDNGNQYVIPLDSNGNFILDILICTDAASVDLFIVDVDSALASEIISVTLTAGTLDLGTIDVCNELPEFIKLEISDVGSDLFLNPYFFEIENLFGAEEELDSLFHFVEFRELNPDPLGVGNYTSGVFSFGTSVLNTYFSANNTDPSNIEVIITHYGSNPGDIIRGTFSGDVDVYENQQTYIGVKQLSGSFKIIHE